MTNSEIYTKPQVIEGKTCIWLQSFGFAPAKAAAEFQAGERMLWNFGISYEVVSVTEASAAFVSVVSKCPKGNQYTQRMKKTRLVAIAK